MLVGPSLTKVGHVSEFTQWILPAMGRHRRHKSLLVGLSLSSTAFMELKTAQDIPQHLVNKGGAALRRWFFLVQEQKCRLQ